MNTRKEPARVTYLGHRYAPERFAAICGLCMLALTAWFRLGASESTLEPTGTELTAPFSADAATMAQRDWANQLSTDVCLTNSLGMPMLLVPPGKFWMGSPENEISLWDQHQPDELLHDVRLTRPFRISAYEVRLRDFRAFVAATGYQTEVEKNRMGGWGLVRGVLKRNPKFTWRNIGFEQKDDFPVVNISWNDAVAFCAWLSEKEQIQYRLPTEAEWEYACRAGTNSPFHFGTTCNGVEANCDGNHPYGITKKGPFLRRTCAVGSYAPNAFGLYDMSGNVNEWCADWYDPKYFATSRADDPKGPAKGSVRAMRGGGWLDWAQGCRSADRGGSKAHNVDVEAGFRVVSECDFEEGERS